MTEHRTTLHWPPLAAPRASALTRPCSLPPTHPACSQGLANEGVLVDALGGDVPLVEVSALKRHNLDELVEAIILAAAEKNPEANAKAPAQGFVIESSNDKFKG